MTEASTVADHGGLRIPSAASASAASAALPDVLAIFGAAMVLLFGGVAAAAELVTMLPLVIMGGYGC